MYRRNEFFNILKTAEGKTSGDTVENKVNDIEKYFLVDPDPDDQQKPDGQMDIQKWIKGPRPSNFFFPDMVSGPDLLVFLKIPGTMKRILCAIQVWNSLLSQARALHREKNLYFADYLYPSTKPENQNQQIPRTSSTPCTPWP